MSTSRASASASAKPPADREHVGGEPSSWVVRWSHLIAPGDAVLDVAAGSGRHARWFAARGHPVVAIERDEAALAALARIPGVDAVAADLEDGSPWPLADDRRFAAVVVTHYLHRPLLPRLIDVLAPRGVLVYETFARGNETVGKPSNPAFLLAPGELLDAVRDRLRVIAFEEGFVAAPRAAFIQRICAVREWEGPDTGERTAATPMRYDLAG